MDVLPKALPEQFFLDASDTCLYYLSELIDVGISLCIGTYMKSPEANPAVKHVIEEKLGEAIKHATFHQELHDNGTVTTLRNLNLEAVAAMRDIDKMQELVDVIQYVYANRKYVHPTIKPRQRETYMMFNSSAPAAYQHMISVNRDYFYDPKAREAPTGLGIIVRRQQDIDIALKGLLYRIHMYKTFPDPSRVINNV